MKTRTLTRPALAAIAVAMLATGCGNSAKDKADAALKQAGVEVPTSGKLPASFPADVPTPAISLETAVAAAGTFTLRYTTKDPKGDMAAYRAALVAAGFKINSEADNLTGPSKNINLMATKGTVTVIAAAFGPDAPGGGNYMGVVV
jgi:hypothetical protein